MNIQNLKRSDFVFTFESQGASYLFEDISARYYMPVGESVTFGMNDRIICYMSKILIGQMNKEGLKREPKDTLEVVGSLQTLMKTVSQNMKTLSSSDGISLESVKEMFDLLANICQQYLYFDFNYWDAVYNEAKNNPELQKNIDLIQKYKNNIRTAISPAFFDSGKVPGYCSIVLRKLAAKFSLIEKELEWYSEKEIISLFSGERVAYPQIEQRQKAFLFYKTPQNDLIAIAGDEADKICKSFSSLDEIKTSFIGKVAHSTGKKIKGKVCIISQDYNLNEAVQKKIREMEQGSILVCETTNPDLIDAMKKSAAIVTDVGGMLSHAAITSRELNIPCIVGTGNASKLLNTGDMVEIDTERGIVTLIK
jgi:phosphohistidine swiveling domain-containing protein